MANIDCNVCDDLKEISTEFTSLGITDTVCTSLKNDTGLNPSLPILHDDCEDLELMNDCLIGRPKDELEKYDQCDWKKFMRKFLWNLHEMLGGIICAVCGLWTNVHSLTRRVKALEDMVKDICGLLNQQMNQNMDLYGTLTGTRLEDETERIGGEIVDNHGEPAVVEATQGSWDGVGFYYKKSVYKSCDGAAKTYEWIQPYIRNYSYNTNTVYNDVIWRVSVAQLQQWGLTNSLINQFTNYPQWWDGYCRSWGEYFGSTLHMQVVNGYLEIKLIGATAGGYTGKVISGMTKDPFMWVS